MAERPPPCRLCLITPARLDPTAFVPVLGDALAAGDVASLIIATEAQSPAAFQRIAELLVPVAQARGVAALVHNDTRIAGRAHADGVHIDGSGGDLEAALSTFRGKHIVGAGGVTTRHAAMSLGEREPDYVFFGRLDGDDGDAIFPNALDLAEWWSGLFQIPALVMGGGKIESVAEAAAAKVEFVALRRAVWEHPTGPAEAVAAATRLLANAGVAA